MTFRNERDEKLLAIAKEALDFGATRPMETMDFSCSLGIQAITLLKLLEI